VLISGNPGTLAHWFGSGSLDPIYQNALHKNGRWRQDAIQHSSFLGVMKTSNVERRYRDGTYLAANPDWDRSDSVWKAVQVQTILNEVQLLPASICEIGCGAGDVLANMRMRFPHAVLTGYDISTDVVRFWKEHDGCNIQFHCGDFSELDKQHYDLILLLDVIEHLENPFNFLHAIRTAASYFVFHFPLDLSASSVLREQPLLQVRRNVGHIHYFTKGLALALLRESGFDVVRWRYTNASLKAPARSLRTRLAALPRRLAYWVNKDMGTRLLGGETLMVLAKSAHE
jgi:hypothetical protein